MLFVQRGLLPGQDALIGLRMSAGLPMPGMQTSNNNKYLSDAAVHWAKTSGQRFREVLLPGMCLPK